MPGEIANAFVRIRPNLQGFQAETESGIKSTLTSVGKIAAGFFAIKGLVNEFKTVADAAAEHQAAFAVLDKTIKNAGASTRLFGTNIELLLEKEAKLKGFTDEELASGFTRLVSVTRDSGKAFKDLALAEDVSRARHIDVATSALALSRALQGSTISLSRLGIIVPKVGTEEAKLRAEHDRLAASGVKFTGSVKEAYTTQLAAAKAADAQGTRLSALAVVQDRFGGSAKAFADAASGRFQRFDVSVHLLEVSLGKLLLPTLVEVTGSLTHWIDELTTSTKIHRDVSATVGIVRNAFSDLRAVVEFLSPALTATASALGSIARFSGVGGILVAVGAFKAVAIATEVATAARAKYLAFAASEQADADRVAAARRTSAEALVQETPLVERHAAAAQADAAASVRAAAGTAEWTAALRANDAALAAGTVASEATSLAAAGSGAAQAAAVQASRRGVTLVEAGAASQLASNLTDTASAAQSATSGIIDTSNSIGGLSADIDHSTNVLKKAKVAAVEHTASSSALATAQRDVAASEQQSAAASAKSSQALVGQTAAMDRAAIAAASSSQAQDGLVASQARLAVGGASVSTSQSRVAAAETASAGSIARQSKSVATAAADQSASQLAIARAAETGSARQIAAYEASAAAAIRSAGLTQGAAERTAAGSLLATATAATRARNTVTAPLLVAEANPAGSARQIQNFETSISRAQALAASSGVMTTAQRETASATNTLTGSLTGEAAALERTVVAAEAAAGAQQTLFSATLAESAAAETAAKGQLPLFLGTAGSAAAKSEKELYGAAKAAGQLEGTAAKTGGTFARLFSNLSRGQGVLVGLGRGAEKLGSSLLAIVGGWPTVVAAALAATAFGVYKLVTAESSLDRANDRLRDGLLALGADLRGIAAASKAASDALSSLKTDRIQVAESKLAVERAQGALATTKAGRGTLEYTQLTQDLASAQDQLRLAEKQLGADEAALASARAKRARGEISAQAQRRTDLSKTLEVERQALAPSGFAALGDRHTNNTANPFKRAVRELDFARRLFDHDSPVTTFTDKLNKDADSLAKNGFPKIAKAERDFSDLFKALDRLPTRKEIQISLKTPGSASGVFAQVALEALRAARSGSAFVAALEKERVAVAKNDPALAKRAGLIENLVRATGHKLPPQIVRFIFRSNVEAGVRRMIAVLENADVSLKTFHDAVSSEARAFEQSNPAISRRLIILNQFRALVGRLPTRHETNVVLNAPTALGAVIALQTELGKMAKVAGKGGEEAAKQFFLGLTKIPFLNSAFKGLTDNTAKTVAAASNDALAKAAAAQLRGQLTTAKQVVDTARQGVLSAQQALSDARQRVTDAQQSLADAITQGNQQISDSLKSAGSNLISIGQSLSDSISKFFDAQSAKSQQAPSGPLAARLKELEKLINEGKGTPAIIAKAQEVEAELNAQSAKGTTGSDKRKERVQRRLADLTDEFNTGKISLARFNREVVALLKREGINYKNAGRVLGVAFADEFRAQLLGLREQAGAIAKFGRRPGLGAFGVSVDHPAEVRSKVQEQIARDQEAVSKAQSTVLKDIRSLSAKERTLAKAEAKADRIRDALAAANKHQAKIADNTSTLVHQNAELLKLAKKRAGDAAVLPGAGSPGIGRTILNAGAAALLRPQIEKGLGAASGSASARRAGRELVREFTALGGQLGDGITLGLRRGKRRFFQELDDLLLGGHRHAKRTARSGSPSLLFAEFGDELVQGLVLGLGRSTPSFKKATEALIGTVTPANLDLPVRLRRKILADDLAAELRRFSPKAPASASLLQNVSFVRRVVSHLDPLPKFPSARDAVIHQLLTLTRRVAVRQPGFPAIPQSLREAVVRQAVTLRRSLATEQPRFPAVPALRDVAVQQRVALRRLLTIDQKPFPAVPGRLRDAATRQAVSLLRELRVVQPRFPAVAASLAEATTHQDITLRRPLRVEQQPFPAIAARLRAAAVQQGVALVRKLEVRQPRFPTVPARLLDAVARQDVRLRRSLAVSQPPFPGIPNRLREASVRQAVALHRELSVRTPPFPGLAARLPTAGIRQAVSLLRNLTIGGNFRTLLARAQSEIRPTLSARTIRQRIDLARTLAERESTSQLLSRAQELGHLATGRASVTVLVGANTRAAASAIDDLRRTAERRSLPLGVRAVARLLPHDPVVRPATRPPAAARALSKVPAPRIAARTPLAAAGRHAVAPLREAVGDRQRVLLIGEERKQTRVLEQMLTEERKQTVLLREEAGPRAKRPPRGPKNPREATREATATAVHNLLGS